MRLRLGWVGGNELPRRELAENDRRTVVQGKHAVADWPGSASHKRHVARSRLCTSAGPDPREGRPMSEGLGRTRRCARSSWW